MRWTKVSPDKLPKDGQECVVIYNGANGWNKTLSKFSYRMFRLDGNKWLFLEWPIVYWIPLPDVPGVEK